MSGLHDRLSASDSPDAVAFLAAFDDFTVQATAAVARTSGRPGRRPGRPSPTLRSPPSTACGSRASPRRRASHNADRAADRERIGAEISAMLDGDPETQAQFQAALHSATVFMPGRERTKTNNIKLVQELRVALQRVRSPPCRRRDVPTRSMTSDCSPGPNCSSRSTIPASTPLSLAEREALMEEVAALQEPFLFHGGRPDMSTYPRRDAVEITAVVGGEVMQGVPGCPGVVTRHRPCRPRLPRPDARSTPATSSSRRSPIRRGRRCSFPRLVSSSTSAHR